MVAPHGDLRSIGLVRDSRRRLWRPAGVRGSLLHRGTPMPLVVLVPLFDDWQCLPPLLRDLDRALAAASETAHVVVVDDGSPTPCPDVAALRAGHQNLTGLQVIELLRNVGTERAI